MRRASVYGTMLTGDDRPAGEREGEGYVRREQGYLAPRQRGGVGLTVQTFTAPELVFHALLTQDGTQRLELARA